MSPYNYPYLPTHTTNDFYGGFYDSPRISLQTVPTRLKNNDLDTKKATIATTSSEYGGFLHVNPERPPKWYVVPNFPTARSPRGGEGSYVAPDQIPTRSPGRSFPAPENSSPRQEPSRSDSTLRFNDREIHLPNVDAVELHMKDKSKILLNVKEFYRRYLDN